ncbi:winged helix-turn-helix transcriptional regulator [Thermophilibacter sp. ET337]|uniref:ATP-binding protein n=1 Tax=Thermophilibacter sp. ET337 TaxID=2973084 RepID=UPI0021AC5C45|nr:ATP-binding protein [Thermophilibacter sp. ET337]MCR8907471.1 winged helix-turn-helix transcriptional regulator [Thermophilibacter sp. ET337]
MHDDELGLIVDRLSPSELFEMQGALLPSDAEAALVCGATAADLDQSLVDAIIEARRRQSSRVFRGAETRESQLQRLGIAAEDGTLYLGGLLAAGLYPQQFYPRLLIDVAVHPDVEKAPPGQPRFIDRQMCDGPLSVCIEDALAVLARNLRKTSHVVGAERHDEWEIPEEVLREALSNALVHREYAPLYVGEAVSVDVYPDRIEIRNPGGLWGGKTVESLGDGSSRCRNPRLMSLMGAVPLEHGGFIAESQGTGIRYMIREMEARSLPVPEFRVTADSFTVILRRELAGVVAVPAPAPVSPSMDTYFLEEKILLELDAQRPTSARELAERIGVGVARIRYLLPKLIEQGKVAPTAGETSRNRRYVLVS